ncbi:monovalent cation/H+ antiporter subunit A [Phaeovulum vinaykumarii]|uniref:Multisubunit potassium/proton antiporter, PhaA subunit /multisubunit potassium/proton antiporter, PhaB subunit n=1 Tax=Phaeovulum vinaykumarii TaxID=407234 RepID=A0A1N7K1A4_9RHOB|nr:monovalent cation/H+ antiporter subunit A [Phaeovulum vinaykumarii]SIS55296.1 multisubunit potassium/proton antiporter, PhaA subunit /multisubunit potassium/proton antiporter, PhaB subunit [Phaeovulum vinaykumarii]SOB92314.1 multisubunit potassium/proton antiporter PhaA subunit /multisubunit potassium/proton antiporter PhaB subunit [Phaeovulum vinaykumarii]
MSLGLIVLLPFFGALLPGLLVRAGRDTAAIGAGAVTLLAAIGVALNAPEVLRGGVVSQSLPWLPQAGLMASFRMDGLGLMFAGLILGIGLLIILYARHYLTKQDPFGKFLSFLMAFQGAMLGIVLSGNVLMLLVFWELTSLTSFLLIGYWRHLPEGRQGARMALGVTASGGLAMLAGLLILGHVAGSYEIADILAAGPAIRSSELYLPALILICIGAFAKSAQFPFHFWLPQAMAAPTPVSAYLHSATMVKAGLYLLARLWPVLSGREEWVWLVAGTGLLTMCIGAVVALFKDDLKGLLAYSTVSHLGLITFLFGLGTKAAAFAGVFHILNHALFKAALFLVAGIIDHAAHTRDLKRLGGLMRLMPLTFLLAGIGTLSMAGVPPFNGFLSKELMLEAALEAGHAFGPLIPVAAGLAAAFSVAYAGRFLIHGFFGPVRHDYPEYPHDPGPGLAISPLVLAGLAVAVGLMPEPIAGGLVRLASGAVTGAEIDTHIALWHGLTPALGVSMAALLGGAVILAAYRPLARGWAATPRPEARLIYGQIETGLRRGARALTAWLLNGALSRYLGVFLVVTLAAGVWALGGAPGPETRPMLAVPPGVAVFWALLVLGSACVVAFHRTRVLALVAVGIVGLMVSMAFVYLSAPDLALTQISVEVVTVILMLLALNFLPKRTPAPEGAGPRAWQMGAGVIATLTGLGAGALSYALMRRDFAFEPISDYHLANSVPGGGGANVVNVILVDFRGYDTFGEITVLGIAALVIYALTESLLGGPASRRLIAWTPDQARAGDRHPLMMVVASRVMMPIAVLVGVYIFLRGHNTPGGGFIAGLVMAIALLMQYMASGFAWAQARQKIYYHVLIGLGVLIAGFTGIASWAFDRPFLTSAFGHVHIPLLGDAEIASAMAFDLGVLLTVVGSVMLALASLSRIARRAGGEVLSGLPAPHDDDAEDRR